MAVDSDATTKYYKLFWEVQIKTPAILCLETAWFWVHRCIFSVCPRWRGEGAPFFVKGSTLMT
jgi:hypothetical protein